MIRETPAICVFKIGGMGSIVTTLPLIAALRENFPNSRLVYVTNPANLPLIERLRKDGVDVAVCGQAWAGFHFDYAWKDSRVTLALSGITTAIDLQQQGYALMP